MSSSALPNIILSAIPCEEFFRFEGVDNGPVDFMAWPHRPEILLGKVKLFLQMEIQNPQLIQCKARLNEADNHLQAKLLERTTELEETIDALRSEIQKRELAEKDMLQVKNVFWL